jgi:hypothetical protein
VREEREECWGREFFIRLRFIWIRFGGFHFSLSLDIILEIIINFSIFFMFFPHFLFRFPLLEVDERVVFWLSG